MKTIAGVEKDKIEVFLRTCKEKLDENREIEFIEMTMGDFLEGLDQEEITEELASLLVEKFLEIDIYITDGLTRLRAGRSRYSRRMKELKMDEKIRIYSY